jgi:hypothetical protein
VIIVSFSSPDPIYTSGSASRRRRRHPPRHPDRLRLLRQSRGEATLALVFALAFGRFLFLFFFVTTLMI